MTGENNCLEEKIENYLPGLFEYGGWKREVEEYDEDDNPVFGEE